MKNQRLISYLTLLSIALVVACTQTVFAVNWTPPTAAPPNNNIAPPLNMGATPQYKAGVLGASTIYQGPATPLPNFSIASFLNKFFINDGSRFLNNVWIQLPPGPGVATTTRTNLFGLETNGQIASHGIYSTGDIRLTPTGALFIKKYITNSPNVPKLRPLCFDSTTGELSLCTTTVSNPTAPPAESGVTGPITITFTPSLVDTVNYTALSVINGVQVTRQNALTASDTAPLRLTWTTTNAKYCTSTEGQEHGFYTGIYSNGVITAPPGGTASGSDTIDLPVWAPTQRFTIECGNNAEKVTRTLLIRAVKDLGYLATNSPNGDINYSIIWYPHTSPFNGDFALGDGIRAIDMEKVPPVLACVGGANAAWTADSFTLQYNIPDYGSATDFGATETYNPSIEPGYTLRTLVPKSATAGNSGTTYCRKKAYATSFRYHHARKNDTDSTVVHPNSRLVYEDSAKTRIDWSFEANDTWSGWQLYANQSDSNFARVNGYGFFNSSYMPPVGGGRKPGYQCFEKDIDCSYNLDMGDGGSPYRGGPNCRMYGVKLDMECYNANDPEFTSPANPWRKTVYLYYDTSLYHQSGQVGQDYLKRNWPPWQTETKVFPW